MAGVTSTLRMTLVDGVTGPARVIAASLKKLQAQTAAMKGAAGMPLGKGAAGAQGGMLMGGGARFAIGATAALMGADAARRSYVDAADAERRLTRIRQTAGATVEQQEQARRAIRAIAKEVGLGIDEVTEGVAAMAAQGKDMPEILSKLPAVTRTAQASGAAIVDVARSANALGDSLKIGSGEMQKAFDILVAGGNAGQFELKDMAQYLPALAPAAAAIGLKGEAGLRKLVAALQMIRNQTGDASSAATNMQNVFSKMQSEETSKKFTKMGVNLSKGMEAGRRAGKDALDVFLDLAEVATKGDLSKLPLLFTDMQVQQGVRALLTQRQALKHLENQLKNVDGTTLRQLGDVSGDAAAGIMRLGNAWTDASRAMGNLADAAGVTSGLSAIAEGAETAAAQLAAVQAIIQQIKGLQLGEAGKGIAKFLAGDPEADPGAMQAAGKFLKADLPKRRIANATAATSDIDADIADLERLLAEGAAKGYTDPKKAQQAALMQETLANMKAQRAVYQKQLTDDLVKGLPPLHPYGEPEIGGVAPRRGITGSGYGRDIVGQKRGAGELPGPPRSKPPALPPVSELGDPVAAMADRMKASGKEAVAEAQSIGSQIMAIFDAIKPVIRPTVVMPNINAQSYESGREAVKSGQGSYSDNGGRR
jgi:TP901 family phage tail tape measure protein